MSQVIIQVLAVLFPVFALVSAGFYYGRCYRPSMNVINQLNFRVFIPALVFDALTAHDFQLTQYPLLVVAGFAVVLGSGLLAWPIARVCQVPVQAFVPPMMFNNCGNMGLPVTLLAFGQAGLDAALVLFLISNALHFTLGVRLVGGKVTLLELLFNPVNAATLVALAVNVLRVDLIAPLQTSVEMAGQVAIPLMLFALGVRMIELNWAAFKLGLLGAVVRPALGFAIVLLLAQFIDFEPLHWQALVLFAVMPPAVLNFMFAERYQQHPDIVASIVIVGNAVSVLFLALALLYLYQI